MVQREKLSNIWLSSLLRHIEKNITILFDCISCTTFECQTTSKIGVEQMSFKNLE